MKVYLICAWFQICLFNFCLKLVNIESILDFQGKIAHRRTGEKVEGNFGTRPIREKHERTGCMVQNITFQGRSGTADRYEIFGKRKNKDSA